MSIHIPADQEERINIILHKLKFISEDQKPAVLVMTSVNPPEYEMNDWLHELLRMAGGRIYDTQASDGKAMFNPDLILVLTDQIEGVLGDLGVLLSLSEWEQTNAVKNNRIYLVDEGNALIEDESKLADNLELLAEIIYPQYLTYGGNGDKWIQFDV
ncbi:substrate-binding domain-containing protein [Albibacterium indicum]|uniref:hypothetical protein n=1 Tax=Albibacterium indicum TaxID=2292082 RepID=UPI000E50F48E|nr:hypothetical protein [Pedobacter indicus]